MKRFSKLTRSSLVILLLILVDQLTKRLALASLSGKGTVPVIGDFFVLLFATNRGGFLSLGSNVSQWFWVVFFVVLPLFALLLLTLYIIRNERENHFFISLWVFITSGGLGNIIDRIFYGEVIDFMNLGLGTLRTGIFNVADLYLNVFAPLVIILYFLRRKKDKPADDVEKVGEPDRAEAPESPQSSHSGLKE